jgi:formylmethanofuran dehydrogenase subunit C
VPLTLAYQADTTIPVEIEGVTPQAVKTQSLAEIRQIEIFHGNEKLPLGEMFDVAGDASDGRIDFHGDLAGVHWLGAHMTEGVVHVHGNAGRHVGSEMSGGAIHVDGNASDWVGGEMHGGLIHIRGRAGHLIGAAYRGSRRGMTGGTILIHGDAGNEIGHTMRRGWIAIGGRSGDLAGFSMLAGTIFLFGETGIRHGAGMRRGTIGLFAPDASGLLPTFRYACRYRPPVMAIMLRQLDQHGFPLEEALRMAEYDLYHGDFIEQGRGEILLRV